MEQPFGTTPLNRICYQDSTYLMEMLLPFLAPNMQYPLVLFIKFFELQRIRQSFKNPELLAQMGFIHQKFTMQKLMEACEDCPNRQLANRMRQAKKMLSMMEMMQAMDGFGDSFGGGFGDGFDDGFQNGFDDFFSGDAFEERSETAHTASLSEQIDAIFERST